MEHGERQAEVWLKAGLRAGGFKEADLIGLKGSDPRRLLLVDLLWRRTVVSQEWLAEKLAIKAAANVSQQLRRLDRRKVAKVVSEGGVRGLFEESGDDGMIMSGKLSTVCTQTSFRQTLEVELVMSELLGKSCCRLLCFFVLLAGCANHSIERSSVRDLVNTGDDIFKAKQILINHGFKIEFGPEFTGPHRASYLMIIDYGSVPGPMSNISETMGWPGDGKSPSGVIRATRDGKIYLIE